MANGQLSNGMAPAKAGILVSLLGPSARRPEPDTSGQPLARVLSEALGIPYQDPIIADLQHLLGEDTFQRLMEVPRIAAAVHVWANTDAPDRPKVAKDLAVVIADEVRRPDLQKRIAWEVRKLG